MVMPKHICPYGAKYLLESNGYKVDDRWLKTREETYAFKAQHDVKTTPQTFIDGQRIGGYDDLRKHFGKPLPDPKATSLQTSDYRVCHCSIDVAGSKLCSVGEIFPIRAGEWFIAFSMCLLAMLKLQDVEKFSTMFVGYDLLGRKWVYIESKYKIDSASLIFSIMLL
jgi:glutaredoxin